MLLVSMIITLIIQANYILIDSCSSTDCCDKYKVCGAVDTGVYGDWQGCIDMDTSIGISLIAYL